MLNKNQQRLRRATRTRAKIRELEVPRLSVHRSNAHIYAQLLAPCGSKTLASASTLEKDLRSQIKSSGNKEAAALVGKMVAERAIKAGYTQVAFDRSGFKYHGRVKALAEAARESGLLF
jgi:large subunit ribosomal protein L18